MEQADKSKTFGYIYIQRICRIGYIQAQNTVTEMVNRRLIKVKKEKGRNYTFQEIIN
jgi:hypothetical protein